MKCFTRGPEPVMQTQGLSLHFSAFFGLQRLSNSRSESDRHIFWGTLHYITQYDSGSAQTD